MPAFFSMFKSSTLIDLMNNSLTTGDAVNRTIVNLTQRAIRSMVDGKKLPMDEIRKAFKELSRSTESTLQDTNLLIDDVRGKGCNECEEIITDTMSSVVTIARIAINGDDNKAAKLYRWVFRPYCYGRVGLINHELTSDVIKASKFSTISVERNKPQNDKSLYMITVSNAVIWCNLDDLNENTIHVLMNNESEDLNRFCFHLL